MKYSAKTIQILSRLRDGNLVNVGELSSQQLKSIVSELSEMEAISFSRKGKLRGYYVAPHKERFIEACGRMDSALSDLDTALRLAQGEVISRSEKVTLFGNSKQNGADRTVKGFSILADRETIVKYNGNNHIISPLAGLHVVDRHALVLPEEATVIIVENAECLYDLRWIPNIGLKTENGPFVILCRFPICEEAKLWLETIPNRILYFGDFDLAGIRIYETEYKRRLGERIVFIIPSDLEERIRKSGNPGLYTKHTNDNLKLVSSPSGELNEMIDLLHRLQSSYEQEGYCSPFPSSSSRIATFAQKR